MLAERHGLTDEELNFRINGRYLGRIWERCSLVVNVEDTREARYGGYYTRRKPLSIAALEG